MASLTPGILLKLIRSIGSDVKIVGAHRSVLLQVIAIAPSLTGCEELCPSHGFFLKLSDSSYATYVSLAHDLDDMIMSNKMQLGQFIYVEKLEAGYPLPVLTRLKLLPGRHPFVGSPDDLVSVNTSASFQNGTGKILPVQQYFCLTKIGKTLIGPASLANPCAQPENRVVSSHLEERRSSMCKENTFSSSAVDGPSTITVPEGLFARSLERRSFQRASWSYQKNVVEILHRKGKMTKSSVASDASSPLREASESLSPCMHLIHRDEPENIVFNFDRVSNGKSTDTSQRKKLVRRDHRKETPYRGSSSVMRSANTLFRSLNIGRSHDQLQRSLYQDHMKRSLSSNVRISSEKGFRARKDAPEAFEEKEISNNDSSKKGADLHGMRDVVRTLPSICEQPYDVTTPIWDMETSLKTSWSNLPVALSSLGQEVMSKHSQAWKDIAEALQQASVTDRIIKRLSDFADLCSLQKFHDHQSYIQQFLTFYKLLQQSIASAETLAEEKLGELNIISEKKREVVRMKLDEKMEGAMAWIDAALSSDLGQFDMKEDETITRTSEYADLNGLSHDRNELDIPNHPVFINPLLPSSSPTPVVRVPSTTTNAVGQSVLSSSARSNIANKNNSDFRNVKSTIKASLSVDLSKPALNSLPGKQSIRCPSPGDRKNYTTDLTKIGHLKQAIKLAKHLQYAAENWFIQFMTNALQSEFQNGDDLHKRSIRSANDSTILEDLRKVNDWLDQVSVEHKGLSSTEVLDRIYCLKQKLYEFLIQLCLQKPITFST